jgi:hypothetical protein
MGSSTTGTKRVQYGALPYRSRARSRTEVMLVTSQGTRRWIIPKGWPQKGRAPHPPRPAKLSKRGCRRSGGQVAARIICLSNKDDGFVICEVTVYPLKISRQSKRWPEHRQRKIRSLSAKEAAEKVQEPRLRKIIRSLTRVSEP